MATRRKAKAKARKAKTKRKKTKLAKAAVRRKAAAKKATARKRSAKKAPGKRAPTKKAPAAKVAVTPPRPPAAPAATMPAARAPSAPREERVGVVTHYYGHLSVAIVRLESGRLHVGDTIRIRGHTTDFTQRVESLQIDHAATTDVGPNDDFGLKVVEHTREHDVVYKVL